MMPPVGGGGDGRCTEQDPRPETGHRRLDAQSRSPPPPLSLSIVAPEKKKPTREYEQRHPTTSLPDDVIIEILSRVGHYKSFCRFKCVSKLWLEVCSGIDTHKRPQQTLSGLYFFAKDRDGLGFHDLTGGVPPLVDPDLSFLGSYRKIEKCCGGLLLCKCWKSYAIQEEFDYVVCNPATERWAVLPPIPIEFSKRAEGNRLVEGRLCDLNQAECLLGFDPVNPSSFVVVAPLADYYFDQIKKVAIYSSETGRWTSVRSEWDTDTVVRGAQPPIFLNGVMHLITFNSSPIATVDRDGKVWRKIRAPCWPDGIGVSQGCLHAWCVHNRRGQLSVWVLEDYGSETWTRKHYVNGFELFGRHCRKDDESYTILAIHPNCNIIFITDEDMTISYDMDNQIVRVINTSQEFLCCAPYIPCFAKWPLDGK